MFSRPPRRERRADTQVQPPELVLLLLNSRPASGGELKEDRNHGTHKCLAESGASYGTLRALRPIVNAGLRFVLA